MNLHIYLLGVIITLILVVIEEIVGYIIDRENYSGFGWHDIINALLLMSISWGGVGFVLLLILGKCLKPKDEQENKEDNENKYPKLN